MSATYHVPVLLDEAVRVLVTNRAWIYVDGTLGGGGHAERVCEELSPEGTLVAFDCDADAIEVARNRLARFGDRVLLIRANFRAMAAELRRRDIKSIGGVLLDLGVSSFQLDAPLRGFSFRSDARLDMRMDQEQAFSALAVVNEYSEQALADVLFHYGEERLSRRIARSIVARRPATTTGALREAVEQAVGQRFVVKSLARVFQALRIEVNHELENLAVALAEATALLLPGGRIVVISYHSLEDRIVKEFFRKNSATTIPSGHKLIPDTVTRPLLRLVGRQPIAAPDEECSVNPRARSAKLRAAEKVSEAE
jgi:16S rRNA (cytosine1402-N4)-methyltransferase